MPFVQEENIQLPRALGVDEIEQDQEFSFKERTRAAFALENEIGAAIVKTGNLPDSNLTNPEYNPFSNITDEEKLDERFLENITYADNDDEINAVRKQMEMERDNKHKLEVGGFFPIALVSVASPINLLPFGGAAGIYKAGGSILKAGLVTGGASAGAMGITEALLHGQQITRTYGESAINVTAGALLGGILGAAPIAVRGKLKQAGHDPDEAFVDIERSMSLERGSSIQDAAAETDALSLRIRSELLAESSARISRGERISLNSEIKDLEFQISRIDETSEEVIKKKGIGARKAKEKAKKEGIDLGVRARENIEDMIAVARSKLALSRVGEIAESDLTRMEQGIIPDRFKPEFDKIKQPTNGSGVSAAVNGRSLSPDEADAVNTVFAGELRSVGADQVLSDVNIRGKLARAVTKFIGFDPLSRTLTSDSGATRSTTVRLASNPLDMDRPVNVSTEAKIKDHDGKFFEALDGHLTIFKEYKAAGGKLSRREFNEEVSKATRNPSNFRDPHVQKAADGWSNKLLDPMKNEAIAVKLLPDDVDVTTARNYLNRLWNKEKIAAKLPDFIGTVSRHVRAKNPDLDVVDAKELAKEIAAKIMSTPDGRLPYDYQLGQAMQKGRGSEFGKIKGAFKSRTFDIPDDLVEDFLENDIEILGARYLKSTAADIEIVREFGDVEMTNALKDMEDDWLTRMESAKTEKERTKMRKQKDRDLSDMAAMRDRIRGTYNIQDFDNPWVRASRVAKDLNYMRLLGGVVAASIPDVGRIVMAEGFVNAFGNGLIPLVKSLKAFKMAAHDAKLGGTATDGLTGGRAEIMADVADYAAGGTLFERGVRSAATKFSSVNLINQWTAAIKQLHAVMFQTRIGNELAQGKYDPRLGQLGISPDNAKNISKQLKKYGKKIDGVWVANTKDWDVPDLSMMWRTAVRTESDRVIIMPGQEKPLFMSTALGSTIFQFKTFMFSATQRIFISSLQQQDKHLMQGLVTLVGFGMLSYSFKQWDAGREITDDPMTMVVEGIDRSGALGILMEFNNTAEKVSRNAIGLRPLLGISAPSSRYASRSVLDSAIGPTFGLTGDIIRVAGSVSQGEFNQGDVRAVRRLLPGQNLSILRQAFDELEPEI